MIAFIFKSNPSFAQEKFLSEKKLNRNRNYTIKSWNSENGLPQNSVQCILQTRNGYLWFSTYNGLVRFDGNEFKVFNTSNTPQLPDNDFRQLFEDSKQNLWILSRNQTLIKYSNNVFEEIQTNEKNTIHAICENENHEILAGTSTGKIYKLVDGKYIDFINVGNYISNLLYTPNKELYIATTKGLSVYKNNQLNEIDELSTCQIFMLKNDLKNDTWVYSDKGLFKIVNGIVTKFPLPKEISKIIYGGDILIEENGRIWITTQKGALIIEKNNYSCIDINSGLSSNTITRFYKDKENNIWIGTDNAGINKLKPKTIQTLSKEDGLIDNICRPILQLKNKTILISHCNNITQWKDGKPSLFNTKRLECIWTMMEDKHGDIWLGTNNHSDIWLGTNNQGIYKYSKGQFSKFDPKEKGIGKGVYALFQDKDGLIWIGSGEGLYTYQNNKFRKIERSVKGRVTYIMQDSKKRIWFGSLEGLGMIENGDVKIYTTKDGLSNNNVRHVYEDKDGVFWIATYGGGINRFKNNTFFAYDSKESIIDKNTSCIIEDVNTNLWISSNKGIFCAPRKSLNDYADDKGLFIHVRCFGKEDGMNSSECNGGFQYSGIKTDDGKIIFPTLGGLSIVNPRMIENDNYTPQIVLGDMLVNDKIIPFTDSVIKLKNSASKIEFNFTAPYFGDQTNLYFKYKLEGFDKEWKTLSKKRSETYLNLPPGEYTFHVSIYGNVSEKTIAFSIPFPFWQTTFFYGLVIFFAALLISGIVYLRIKRELNKTELNKQYAALELKALQAQMNPHFMFNCLNTIKYFIVTDDKISASDYLSRFSQLIRLFLDHSNSNFVSLENEINLLSLYIEMEQLRLDNGFDFQLNVDHRINTKELQVPTMLLQPFIENAIHHGLRNLEEKGILVLSFILEKDSLKILIDDNGIGQEKAGKLNLLSAKYHKSKGMELTQERITTLNYIKNMTIEIGIEDKPGPGNTSNGTLVIINIPLTKK